MMDKPGISSSVVAAIVESGRGLLTKPGQEQPAIPLKLYDLETCPWCRLVREALTQLDLDVLVLPCPKGGQRYRPEVSRLGGKQQFPYLVDPNTATAMYESDQIIDYLGATYGNQWRRPGRLRRWIHKISSAGVSIIRGSRGHHVVTSSTPDSPLLLYSFESSPYTRPVRERLTELEIPYHLLQCGRTQWRDWLTAPARKRHGVTYRPTQRNRHNLLKRTGKVAVPYLIDPDTGTELFECVDILHYLDTTYASH